MAEFSLRHVKRVVAITHESPFDALRADNLQRACELANLADPMYSALWHLLLAWELREVGRREQAKRMLKQLGKGGVLVLPDWKEGMAADILPRISDVSGREFTGLCLRLLEGPSLAALCSVLTFKRDASIALSIAQGVEDRWDRAGALRTIAAAQAQAGDPEGARQTFAQALATAQGVDDTGVRADALQAIAAGQARLGVDEEAMRTADQILTQRNRCLQDIAEAFVESRNAIGFKRLLIPCSHYLETTYKVCMLLTRLYPDHARAIADAMRRVG